ncbi:hypothetical protein EVAR_34680_1 [Eumeta japonica]|uniref:Uncharacterized protein n=1 Tax=Eumeta variegata TaxID=151549 RepID=A0A4C1VG97_EUMVA|nr:hypothetical protein EVAR_34680_1 [Eumeta japonica]
MRHQPRRPARRSCSNKNELVLFSTLVQFCQGRAEFPKGEHMLVLLKKQPTTCCRPPIGQSPPSTVAPRCNHVVKRSNPCAVEDAVLRVKLSSDGSEPSRYLASEHLNKILTKICKTCSKTLVYIMSYKIIITLEGELSKLLTIAIGNYLTEYFKIICIRGVQRQMSQKCRRAPFRLYPAECRLFAAEQGENYAPVSVLRMDTNDLYLSLAIFQIVGHLYILKNSLTSIPRPKNKTFNEVNDMTISVEMFDNEENKQVYKDISECISHHCMIIRFTDEVSALFGPTIAISYLFHLFGCCLSLLQVLSGVRRYDSLLGGQNIALTDHPSYSTDLAPKYFYLFPSVNNKLRGQRFSSREEAVDAFKMRVLEIPKSEWEKQNTTDRREAGRDVHKKRRTEAFSGGSDILRTRADE